MIDEFPGTIQGEVALDATILHRDIRCEVARDGIESLIVEVIDIFQVLLSIHCVTSFLRSIVSLDVKILGPEPLLRLDNSLGRTPPFFGNAYSAICALFRVYVHRLKD